MSKEFFKLTENQLNFGIAIINSNSLFNDMICLQHDYEIDGTSACYLAIAFGLDESWRKLALLWLETDKNMALVKLLH